MTYDQLLPVYRHITGLPGQDAAFNQWVQGIINVSGSQQGVEGIPNDFFNTAQGRQYLGQTNTTGANVAQTGPGATTAPDLQQSLMAYFNAEPGRRAEWERVRALGDKRSEAEWMYDHIKSSPQDQQQFSGFVSSGAAPQIPSSQPVTGDIPLEQALLDQFLPYLLADAEGDAERRQLVEQLTGQAYEDYMAARNALSPEASAARLQEEYRMADETTGRMVGSSQTAAAEQLAALQQSISAMQGNLTGALAERAAALQQMISTLNANLDTMDAEQKAALAEQIASTQQNLETSIAAQRQALQTEVDSLRTAADANSVARKAALQAEIDGLTAAQAPMAQARLDSANALATAINLGLESTIDQLTAQRAKQGYLGTSSFDNAALARATVGARQGAAQAMGAAREQNAADTRAIQARLATEGRGLDDELANNLLGIDTRSATGTRSLADLLATGTQSIGDAGAAGLAGIRNNTASTRFNIGGQGAATQFQDQTFGADQKRALADALAGGTLGIKNTASTQQQEARDAGTMARQGYFDNAYTRTLGGTLSRASLADQLAGTLGNLGSYGSSGLNRTLGTLNWWGSSATPPTAQYQPVEASTQGNDIAGLGAGLLGSALNIGNANNWWKKSGTANTNTASPTGYTTPAGNVGVQTDWSNVWQ